MDESRQARVRRLCAEVRSGSYRVDEERLCLCILAGSAERVAAQLAGRDVQRAVC